MALRHQKMDAALSFTYDKKMDWVGKDPPIRGRGIGARYVGGFWRRRAGAMRQKLHAAMFEAPWWSIAFNPHFLPRRAIFQAMRGSRSHLRGRVLDVGCGTQPYRELLTNADAIVGLELDTPANRAGGKRADVFYDGTTLPFPSGSFQSVLCNQVLEHVFEPKKFLAEITRGLVPGGILVLSVPFFWPEHERPWDSQRFTSYGLMHQLADAGLTVDRSEKLVAGSAAICALIADRINAGVSTWPRVLRFLVRAFAIAPWSLLGSLLLLLPKDDPALFLDNFVVAHKRPTVG